MEGLARPPRRPRRPLALLTATAALASGAQALTPSPAEAMINLGDCANLSGPALFECEMRGAGAGSGSGGGGGQSTGGSAGDQIIGEPIYVSGTRPSHCQLSPSSCLPTTPGGRHQIGSDGVRPRGPRPGHRPVRVSEVAKGKLTKEECERLKDGRLQVSSELEMREVEDRIVSTDQNQGGQEEKLSQLRAEAERLAQWVQALKKKHAPSKDVVAADERHRAALRSILAMESEIRAIAGQFDRLVQDHQALQIKRDAELRPLRKQCKDRHHISI